MSAKLDELYDRLENLRDGDFAELSTIVIQLLDEVRRIDSASSRAANVASCLANGIQPD